MIFLFTQISFSRREVFGTYEKHECPFPLLISRYDFCRKLRKYVIYYVEKYVFYYSLCNSNRNYLSFIIISIYVGTWDYLLLTIICRSTHSSILSPKVFTLDLNAVQWLREKYVKRCTGECVIFTCEVLWEYTSILK